MGVAAIKKESTTAALAKKEVVKKEVAKKETTSAAASALTLNRLPKTQLSSAQATVSSSSSSTALSLSSKRLANVEDIDANDKENLVLVSEYVNDIYDYLYQLEDEQPIHPDHLDGQLEVSQRMRSVLIDWINEVHLQFHMAAETFQLAVAIIDRYLQVVKNTKRS
ncbi:G2/mitotic-specific cyclin-B-like [Drosophila tropicalis]